MKLSKYSYAFAKVKWSKYSYTLARGSVQCAHNRDHPRPDEVCSRRITECYQTLAKDRTNEELVNTLLLGQGVHEVMTPLLRRNAMRAVLSPTNCKYEIVAGYLEDKLDLQ